MSTKEMGPGSRRDTLDDHFVDYNWRKIMVLPSTLYRKADVPVAQREEHVTGFLAFNDTLPDADVIAWTGMVCAWEESPFVKPNLGQIPSRRRLQDAVRLEMAREEEAQLQENLTNFIHEDVLPSQLISQGLELGDH
ncbi:hypothetical protein C0991_004359, partial [Blastosporella zonata]